MFCIMKVLKYFIHFVFNLFLKLCRFVFAMQQHMKINA